MEDAIVRIRYTPGHNDECETCVIEPADLRDLILEAVRRQDPAIAQVELVTEGGEG